MTEGGGGQWRLNLRLVGEALGRTNDAERLLTTYDEEAALTRRAIRGARAKASGAGRKPRVAVVRMTADGMRYAPRDSFAGTILADAGVTQVTRKTRDADLDAMLLSTAPGVIADVDGRFEAVAEALWWGSGGALAARAALRDLRTALAG
jgi:ABC-type Fe3+-hydroxamate transport system substrate-binding protein